MKPLLAIPLFLWAPSGYAADLASVEAFYKGRTITLINGATPDGGDEQQERIFSGMTIVSRDEAAAPGPGRDAPSRLAARHLGRHLPGTPRISVVTLPGASGLRAARHVAEAAARDGSVIGALERGLAVAVPASAYGWIGALGPDTGLLIVRRDAGFAAASELRERELVIGGTLPQDESVRLARGLNAILGTKLRVIGGYRGSGALHQAIERGEVSGYIAGNADDAKPWLIGWLQAGSAFALLQLGPRALPWLNDVPLAETLAANDTERAALERLFVNQQLGLPFVAPPGVPPERLAALRAAFDAMTQDPAFLKEARQAGVTADGIGGDALERLIGDIAKRR